MPKIIDEKIKRITLEKYRNGESYNKIASDLDLKSGGQIVRLWIKRYNINNEAFINRKCETDLFMSKDLELKLLKEELKKTQKENEQLKSKIIKEKVKYQLLEKCMPSCTSMTQNQIVIMTRKKAWKNKAINSIYFDSKNTTLSTKEKCEALYVNKGSYYRWKNKNIEVLLIGEKIKYNRKYNKQAMASINKFIKKMAVLEVEL